MDLNQVTPFSKVPVEFLQEFDRHFVSIQSSTIAKIRPGV